MADLSLLAEPFHPNDIEWRISQSDVEWCRIVPYLTSRAVMARLDAVCGPENWCNTPCSLHEMRVNVNAVQVGISIRINDEWVTKYDVAEPSNIESAKGGYSGAMKRAGVHWGIGRYLYHLTEMYAVLSKGSQKPDGLGWRKHKIKGTEKVYYWRPPELPGWAMPKVKSENANETESPVTDRDRSDLYFRWKTKLAGEENDKAVLRSAFDTWVYSIVGPFPISDLKCWTPQMLTDCSQRLLNTKQGGKGPTADVHF